MIKDNFIKLYEDSFKNNWEKVAVVDYVTQKSYTYQQFAEKIDEFHSLFSQMGITVGDKVAVCGKNSTSWVIAYMSVVTYGAVIVPILDEFNQHDLMHILGHSESKLFFADNDIAAKIPLKDIPNIQGVVSLNDFTATFSRSSDIHLKELLASIAKEKSSKPIAKEELHYADKCNSTLAAIYYTSGTVSLTKGVMLTGNNLAGNVHFALTTFLDCGLLKRSLVVLPLAHAYGTAFDMLSHLAAGGTITLLGKAPSPQILTKACQEVKPTLIFLVPLVLEKIYKNKIAPSISKPMAKFMLKLPLVGDALCRSVGKKIHKALGGSAAEIIIGGAALNPEVEEFFLRAKFPLTVGYGMTECAPLISYSNKHQFVAKSVGRALEGLTEVKIDRENPEDEKGEILVRGEHTMMGYYKDEDATKSTFTEDGWLRTGDLGYMDKGGNIFINGRAKTMILTSNGENIYPEAIESKLNNLPLISESLVLQIGKKINAYVYPDLATAEEANVPIERINSVMRDNRMTVNTLLSRYERINRIVILDEPMPKTPKKTIKRLLAERMIDEKRKAGLLDE